MTSEKTYNQLSETVYFLDPKHKKYNPKLDKGAIIPIDGQKYEILETKNEPKNGMQAMAVAPIVNGKADTSQVVIAYDGCVRTEL